VLRIASLDYAGVVEGDGPPGGTDRLHSTGALHRYDFGQCFAVQGRRSEQRDVLASS
jgi:hypothetical protein